MEYVLETSRLTKKYSGHAVVDNVDMHIQKGDIYGFIGKNGAGKTTFMKMICGLSRPSGGSYQLLGMKNADQARKKIGSLIENPALFPRLTVKENIIYYQLLKDCSRQKAADLISLVGLEKGVLSKKAANLSLGMKQRLSIAIALMNDPEFLVLDEPINGLDPEGIIEVRELLIKLNKERGITIMISSHILGELQKLVTRYGMIRDGKLIKEFSAEDLSHTSSGKIVIETSDYDRACRILKENGISISSSYEQSEDLEHYFMELMGE